MFTFCVVKDFSVGGLGFELPGSSASLGVGSGSRRIGSFTTAKLAPSCSELCSWDGLVSNRCIKFIANLVQALSMFPRFSSSISSDASWPS